jgi:large subunit ribosomal protein L7/L12
MTDEKKEQKPQAEVKEETKPKEEKKEDAAKAKPEIELSKQAQELIKSVESMTVLELSNLVKALEDKFDVSASMAVMAGPAAGQAGGAQAAEEKNTFTVELTKVGANKIQVIKEVRAVTSLGLKEAKDLVDSAPKPVKQDVDKEEAEEIKKKLTAVGATVELK